jgi:hypothetical protein
MKLYSRAVRRFLVPGKRSPDAAGQVGLRGLKYRGQAQVAELLSPDSATAARAKETRMSNAQNTTAEVSHSSGKKDVTVFNIPIGKLGLLSSLLMGGVCGFLVFFVTFFLAIIGVTIYDSATGTSMLNLNISYLYIAAPVGVLAMLISVTYLLTLWARRKLSGAE